MSTMTRLEGTIRTGDDCVWAVRDLATRLLGDPYAGAEIARQALQRVGFDTSTAKELGNDFGSDISELVECLCLEWTECPACAEGRGLERRDRVTPGSKVHGATRGIPACLRKVALVAEAHSSARSH
jgi:hypothetical protein